MPFLCSETQTIQKNYMKKIVLSVAFIGAALSATAGGYLTNTNQSVAFLRNPAQDAAVNLNGVYSNPAGVAFLKQGFHVGLNWQAAFQSREVTSKFTPFANGANNMGDTKLFKATASAPFIPSLQAAWVKNRWAVQFNFALVGGGGKAEFDQGMGSFESKVALLGLAGTQLNESVTQLQRAGQVIPALAQTANALGQVAFNKYKADAYMRGKQYYFGATLGTSFRINDNFSIYGGVRGIYATAHYYGHLKNIQVNPGNGTTFQSAPQVLGQASQILGQTATAMAPLAAASVEFQQRVAALQSGARTMGTFAVATQDLTLNADQSAFGIAPIVGAHFHSDFFDVAAKYEFRTRIEFENESANSPTAALLPSLAAYRDDAHVRSDIPALLTVGAQVRPIEGLRLNLGYHHYFDKQAKSGLKGAYRNELLSGGTHEYLFGAEYDLNKRWEVSAGVQRTVYPNTDKYMNDLTFTANSTSLGLGVGYQVSERVKVNAGYFHTFYDTYHKESNDYNDASSMIANADPNRAKELVQQGALKGSDDFTRKNFVFGLGVEVSF